MGNGAYDQVSLQNPVNDATAMATALERSGYEVILETDRTRRNMTDAIEDFRERLKVGGRAVFYFAGHGVQVDGSNFLLPVDADLTDPAGVVGDAVKVSDVLDLLSEAKTSLNLVILDCCRDNPLLEGKVDGAGLATQLGPPNTMIAFSTAPGNVALDGESDHLPYTAALLNHIDNPQLTITDLFRTVASDVVSETDEMQRPWKSDDFAEDFHLVYEREIRKPPQDRTGEGFVFQFAPAKGTRRKYRQSVDVTGRNVAPNGQSFEILLSLSQDSSPTVLERNKLTGITTMQTTVSDFRILLEVSANGKALRYHWAPDSGAMPPIVQQILTPAGIALVERFLEGPYSFPVNQIGQLDRDGRGLDEVYVDCAPKLGVKPVELKTHLVGNGFADLFGPYLLFAGSRSYPPGPVQPGDKWKDLEATEFKLIGVDEDIFRIAATNAEVENIDVSVTGMSGVLEIERATGLLHRLSLRGKSDFGAGLQNGYFTFSVEQID